MNARHPVARAAIGGVSLRAPAAAVGVVALCLLTAVPVSGAPALAAPHASAMHAAKAMTLPAEPTRVSQGATQNVGKQVYDKWCAPCHAPGPAHPGTVALDALYRGSKPGALIERTDLTPPIVKQFVRKGVSVMPFFRKTEINDAELDALGAFLTKPPGAKAPDVKAKGKG